MEKRRIAIIASANRGGGSETFLRGLLPILSNITNEFEYHLFVAESRKLLYENISNVLVVHSVPDEVLDNSIRRFVFENFTIVSALKKNNIHLCFYTSEVVSPFIKFLKVPIINMYHSALQFYKFPGLTESKLKLFYIRIMRDISMHFVDKTVAVSNYEKAEVGGRYPQYMYSKLIVIYHGVDNVLFNSKIDNHIKHPNPYILCISDRHKHKNMIYMLEVYDILLKKYKINEHLVFIGRSKSEEVDSELFSFVEHNQLRSNVHFIDYIDNNDINIYYRNAKLYWTNSIYESFGLTPLEAMASETPVVAAWENSLPEVYGDSALFYNLNFQTKDEVAEIIYQLLVNENLRNQYIKRGITQVEKYKWEFTALNYKQLFHKVLDK